MKEFRKEHKSMNDWMDETEKLVNSLSVNMDPKKATRVQDKINVGIQRHLDVFISVYLFFSPYQTSFFVSLKTEDLPT